MKKIILLTTFIACNVCALAQQHSVSDATKKVSDTESTLRVIPAHDVIQSPPFFSEDFSAGIPAGWTNVDNSGNNVLWRTTMTGATTTTYPVDEQLSSIGTSAANGYLILDSDSAGSINENSNLTTSPINCIGHNFVFLSFNEYFAQYANSTATVWVSNDSITWVDVHHADAGVLPDTGTANPSAPNIDISATAANQATVYVRFSYVGANEFWWFIDDVKLYEPSSTDLSTYAISALNSEYSRIPFSQAASFTLSAEVKNVGLNTASGGTALYEVIDAQSTSSVFSDLTNIASLTSGAAQVVSPSSQWVPVAAGYYYAKVTTSIAGDGDPSNDVLQTDTVWLTDSTYARDDDFFAGVQPLGFGGAQNAMGGLNYKVNAAGDITSITFFLKDTFNFSATGTPLYFTIHPQLDNATAPDGATVLATSDTLMLFDGMIPAGGAFYTLHIQNGGMPVTPGLYFIGFHEVDGLIPLGFSNSILTRGASWIYSIGTGWFKPEDYGFSLTYMIRANFGVLPDAVAEIPVQETVMIYPNPSSGVFRIRFAKADENYTVQVLDALDKCVYHSSMDGVSDGVINLSDAPAGIYSVHVNGSRYSAVKKICIAGK